MADRQGKVEIPRMSPFNPLGVGRNTRIDYLYRDGENNKVGGHAIFAGSCDIPLQDAFVKAALHDDGGDMGSFIPGQVGLRDLEADFVTDGPAMWSPDRDHPVHEILAITCTDDPPTDPRTINTFLLEFRKASQAGWDLGWRPSFHAEMAAAFEAAHPAAMHDGDDETRRLTLTDALDDEGASGLEIKLTLREKALLAELDDGRMVAIEQVDGTLRVLAWNGHSESPVIVKIDPEGPIQAETADHALNAYPPEEPAP